MEMELLYNQYNKQKHYLNRFALEKNDETISSFATISLGALQNFIHDIEHDIFGKEVSQFDQKGNLIENSN